jgi:hypothetical protein
MKNYYDLLDIKPDATEQEIADAYEARLELQEKSPQSWPETRKKELDRAFDTLIDPTLRARYDEQLAQLPSPQQEKPQRKQNEFWVLVKKWFMRRPLRRAMWLAFLLIYILLRIFGGNPSSEERSSPRRDSTVVVPAGFGQPGRTLTPDAFTDARFMVATGIDVNDILCTGEVRSVAFAYDTDEVTRLDAVPAGTEVTYRYYSEIWVELIDSDYGDLLSTASVNNLSCREEPRIDNSTATPPPSEDVAGRRCYLRNNSENFLQAYVRKDTESAEAGRLAQDATFYGVSDGEGWFAVTAATTRNLDGYVQASQVEVQQCAFATVTPTVSD